MKKTMLVCFEGGDMTGKTTAITKTIAYLESKGLEVLYTREPGGDEIGEEIREILLKNRPGHINFDSLMETYLFAAARRSHLLNKVSPICRANEYDIIILDRYLTSSAVYQGYANSQGKDRKQAAKEVYELNMSVIKDPVSNEHIMPDLTLILDVDPVVALARRNDEDKNRLDNKPLEYHQLIREGYHYLMDEVIDKRKYDHIFIDASQDIDTVAFNIHKELTRHLLMAK